MTNPRDVPGWTQQREPPDDSECKLLREMSGDGYALTEEEINETYVKLGGAEHFDMIDNLEMLGYCEFKIDDGVTTWTLTEQGRKALGL